MPENTSFRERLKQNAANAPRGASEELWLYREAAAVLASFDYEKLRALGGGSPSSTAKAELLADCDVVYSPSGELSWSLSTPVRQAALRRLLAGDKIYEALDANPDRPDSLVQHMLEQFLVGEVPPTSSFESPEEGRALLEVIDWLNGVPELARGLPSAEMVKQQLAYENLLQPFRDLVGTNFAGRRGELNDLADYVGVQESHALSESVYRTFERIFSIHDRPPLFINGPGGCGKSTLIAKFILDHAEPEEFDRFPFAYLDFDRAGLVAEEPITLLAEVLRQLAIQFPHTADQYRYISDEWSESFSAHLTRSGLTGLTPAGRKRIKVEDREIFLQQFADFVNGMKTREQPLLLVLDTFEEVQFRSTAFADEVLDFLNDLQARVPRLRSVLSGRAEIHSSRYKVRRVALGNFDQAAAVSYLAARGLLDSRIAERIYEQVGGNPLVLRLAADVAIREHVGKGGIDSLHGSGWFSIFRKESVEVVLYKRILSHVYDKRVEELAYPGLVLRVITPEVLRDVLAPACEVQLTSDEDARNIVKVMRAQLSTLLVPSGNDDTLTHRPDMRSILVDDVLRKALRDKAVAEKLSRIHKRAIEFYGKYDDHAHRAEEIYHRLALGIDRETLASRWMEGLTPYLGSSIRELPPESQIYLAARLGLELPDERWTEANDEDWILYASRLADQQLELQKPFDALNVLEERKHLWGTETFRSILNRVTQAVFHDYARQYEQLRETHKPGNTRTGLMNSLVSRIAATARALSPEPSYPGKIFAEGTPGARVVALAITEARSYPEHMDIAVAAIRNALSPFEQYHALRLARRTFDGSTDTQRTALRGALLLQEGTPIHESDASRTSIRDELLKKLGVMKILIVDDDPNFRASVIDIFSDANFLFKAAGSVEEAKKMLDADRELRIILLDLELSGQNGTQILDHIIGRVSEYRVIIITGHDELLPSREARDYKVFYYLSKAEKGLTIESLRFAVEQASHDIEREKLTRADREARFDDVILNRYPAPFTYIYQELKSDLLGLETLTRQRDIFRLLLNFSAVALVSEYFGGKRKSDELDARILERLHRPTLSDWLNVITEITERKDELQTAFFLNRFSSFFTEENRGLLGSMLEMLDRYLGQAVKLSEFEYQEVVQRCDRLLVPLLQDYQFITQFLLCHISSVQMVRGEYRYRLRECTGANPQLLFSRRNFNFLMNSEEMYLVNLANKQFRNLHPFIVMEYCGRCGQSEIFFYEALADGRLHYTSYKTGHTFHRETGQKDLEAFVRASP